MNIDPSHLADLLLQAQTLRTALSSPSEDFDDVVFPSPSPTMSSQPETCQKWIQFFNWGFFRHAVRHLQMDKANQERQVLGEVIETLQKDLSLGVGFIRQRRNAFEKKGDESGVALSHLALCQLFYEHQQNHDAISSLQAASFVLQALTKDSTDSEQGRLAWEELEIWKRKLHVEEDIV